MLEFRPITLADQDWITACLRVSGFRGCEYSFANNLAWRRLQGSQIAQAGGFYIYCSFDTPDGIPSFFWPAGQGDEAAVLCELRYFAKDRGAPLRITDVSRARLTWLAERCPDAFETDENRGSWDYVYRSAELAALAGRRFHQKRNHLHRFAAYDAVCAPLTAADADDCILLAARLYNERLAGDRSGAAEQFAIDTYFRHFTQLGLQGVTLRIGGSLAAFAIGEPLCADTFCVHIEKADTAWQGAYAAVNQAFAQHIAAQGFAYINREEDLDLPGLRKAKLSYHPAFLLEKYCVTFR